MTFNCVNTATVSCHIFSFNVVVYFYNRLYFYSRLNHSKFEQESPYTLSFPTLTASSTSNFSNKSGTSVISIEPTLIGLQVILVSIGYIRI